MNSTTDNKNYLFFLYQKKFSYSRTFCTSLTSITLHENYNEVKERDFSDCTSLSSITLPSTVTKISRFGFNECSSLTSINLDNVNKFEKDCFRWSGITKEKYKKLIFSVK